MRRSGTSATLHFSSGLHVNALRGESPTGREMTFRLTLCGRDAARLGIGSAVDVRCDPAYIDDRSPKTTRANVMREA
jgi:hypothetical protein